MFLCVCVSLIHSIHLIVFDCFRSANYHHATGVCDLSEMDRITLAATSSFQQNDGKFDIQTERESEIDRSKEARDGDGDGMFNVHDYTIPWMVYTRTCIPNRGVDDLCVRFV